MAGDTAGKFIRFCLAEISPQSGANATAAICNVLSTFSRSAGISLRLPIVIRIRYRIHIGAMLGSTQPILLLIVRA